MPSGRRKRKAAKKKMESLGVVVTASSTIQQGNGGSDSSCCSPMSPEVGDPFKTDQKEWQESDGIGGDAEAVKDVEVSELASSDSAVVVPISQPDVMNVEHVAELVQIREEPVASINHHHHQQQQQQPVPISSEEKVKPFPSSTPLKPSEMTEASTPPTEECHKEQIQTENKAIGSDCEVPQPEQRSCSSWLSCCGLLDVLSASNR